MNPAEPACDDGLLREALDHHHAGRLAEAERLYRQILSRAPRHADALHLLGMTAFQTGHADEAIALIENAIAVKGDAPSYHSNLGNVLQSEGRLAQAGACYQRALLLKPDSPEIYVNLGNIFRAQGELESSLTCYRRALRLRPGFPDAITAEASVLLLEGNYTGGWPGTEQRWNTLDRSVADREMPRSWPWPRWQGQPLPSGRLLVWREQGIGDQIMFAGLIPDLLRSGISPVLDCDPRLLPLYARSFPGVPVVPGMSSENNPGLSIAAHLPCASLPAHFRTSASDFRATTSPYLFPDPVLQARFRNRYRAGRSTVGLAWSTTNQKTGRWRSIDLSLLAPLFAVPGIRWISLQYGDPSALEHQANSANAPLLIDRDVDALADLDRFAAQVAAMDLVVTIDNSTAHLAGALGVPTWVLLPFAPDWRWLLDRSDCPWYPSLRLFRQPRFEDWASVLCQVRDALGVLFAGLAPSADYLAP